MVLTDQQKSFLELAFGVTLNDPAPSVPAEVTAQKSELSGLITRLKRDDPEAAAAANARLADLAALLERGDTDAALEEMDALELELAAGLPPSNVGFQKLRLRWQEAKKTAAKDLDKLQSDILAEYDDPEAAGSAKRLDEVLAAFNAGLSDALDDIMNAEQGSRRSALCAEAGGIVSRYLDFVFGSPLVAHVETNPFRAIDISAVLAQPLQLMEIELAKHGA